MNYLVLLLFSIGFSLASWAKTACPSYCDDEDDCLWSFYIDQRKVDFYSNYPINQVNDCVDQVIVAIHGTARDAWQRFDDVFDAVKERDQESRVLIIAPYFKTAEDNPEGNDYYWSSDGWKKGNTSNIGRNDISSFEVTDLFLNMILSSNNFMDVGKVTITGHSAGGQYTQLYALTSPIPEYFSPINFSFLVLNPSNYSFLNEYRPHPTTAALFEVPVSLSGGKLKMRSPYNKSAGDCANSYDDYKYGLNERNLYSSDVTESQLISQYLDRDVHYFLGSEDRYQNDNLDTSCSAKIQGRHRLERGINFFNFLNTFYEHGHSLAIVDGVGHDAEEMYSSEEVLDVLVGSSLLNDINQSQL